MPRDEELPIRRLPSFCATGRTPNLRPRHRHGPPDVPKPRIADSAPAFACWMFFAEEATCASANG